MDKELFDLVAGKKMGSGCFRDVYLYRKDTDLVIKVAKDDEDRKHNLMEMAIWEEIQDTKYAKWFAPCVAVSGAGKYLVQKRAKTGPVKFYPKRLPAFFTDLHTGNYGWIKDQFVCFDYAYFNLTKGLSGKLVAVKWSGD